MKFDPAVNLGQLLIAASFVGSVIGAAVTVREDVVRLKEQVATIYAKDARDDQEQREFRRDVLEQLRGMNDELKRLNERLTKQEAANNLERRR